MTNVSIARLPIPSMTLLLWANGKATRSEPIGTTVRLEATCTTGASVTFYIQKEGSDTSVTLEGKDLTPRAIAPATERRPGDGGAVSRF